VPRPNEGNFHASWTKYSIVCSQAQSCSDIVVFLSRQNGRLLSLGTRGSAKFRFVNYAPKVLVDLRDNLLAVSLCVSAAEKFPSLSDANTQQKPQFIVKVINIKLRRCG
jgi:hypothetical protein